MKKYLSVFSNYIATAFEYRSNLVTTVLLEAISIGSILILWLAVFKTNSEIAGYNFYETILYYVMLPLTGFITSVEISGQISEQIRQGSFSNYLLKPYKFWLVSFANALSFKLVFLLFLSPIYIAVITLLLSKSYLNISLINVLSFLLVAFFAFIFHFILDLTISLLAFWVDDIWAFKHIKDIFFSVLGGISFPLDFIVGPLKGVVLMLPFKYLYYVPITYFLGKQSGITNLITDIGTLIIWSFFFACLSYLTWKLGITKYGAYGN